MVQYRRNRAENGTYFFTVTLKDRRSDLLVQNVEILREAWRNAASRVRHDILAAVILPDHLHALITMRDASDDYPRLWQDIKKGFTRRLETRSSPWQPRYWEHTIRDQEDLQAHSDYIHINPVKHGLVSRAVDWPYSSFHRLLNRGIVQTDWACGEAFSGQFGEPVD